VCGTNFDGEPIPELDRDNVRQKVRKPNFKPEALNATFIPAATGYGTTLVERKNAEVKGDLRLQWEGETRARSAFAEALPVALAALIGLAFFPEASLIARLAVAMAAGGVTYMVVMVLVGGSLIHYLEVTHDKLFVRQGQIWSEVLERLPAGDVEQLYVIRYARGVEEGKPRYEVRCRTKGGEVVSICRGLHSLEQALWIEFQIERHLGVVDVPVEGEVGRA
jgi:hypothetical protein